MTQSKQPQISDITL